MPVEDISHIIMGLALIVLASGGLLKLRPGTATIVYALAMLVAAGAAFVPIRVPISRAACETLDNIVLVLLIPAMLVFFYRFFQTLRTGAEPRG